jgi:hypothetical protein
LGPRAGLDAVEKKNLTEKLVFCKIHYPFSESQIKKVTLNRTSGLGCGDKNKYIPWSWETYLKEPTLKPQK